MTAPPDADVMERAALALNRAYHRVSFDPDPNDRTVHIEEVARALQQYGDERAASAIEEAAGIADRTGAMLNRMPPDSSPSPKFVSVDRFAANVAKDIANYIRTLKS